MSTSKESKDPVRALPTPRPERIETERTRKIQMTSRVWWEISWENPPVDTALVNEIIGAPVIRIDKYWTQADEDRSLQARLEAYEEDSQRLQQQLDQEKRERQKVRETQDQRYRLLEAEVQSLKEKLDAQSSMSLPVAPQQTEEPRRTEEHLSETHDATSPEPWAPRPQDPIPLLASAPEGFQWPSVPQKAPVIPRYTVRDGSLKTRNPGIRCEMGFEQTWVSRAT